ncbi:MAG TPA: ATP-binding cassette domain-containing protein, partial [Aestuariivirgaceae bacterium]
MAEGDAIISLKAVSKTFGPVRAVDGVSFDIMRGEFFSLLGPSGCGKTTLLRILAGFEDPSAGDVLIDGQSVIGVPANERPTNMVFQSYAIFPHLTVAENIAYGLRKKGLSKAEMASTVENALEMIKLSGYGDRGAHQLSGGQRQRVALARALVCRPKVLLLDEPLGALDKKLREEMQIELRALQRSVGITFVFVTHDQEEALTLSDRIAVMSKGKTLQIDNATRLYEAPNCREVADFIGSMNFFDGAIKGIDNGHAIVDV